ncbi:HAUS augmin-like complex subunit 4 isoform X1 [Erythrolamprus reginae]|uniref:HAUS augmin-like complex subunit 4 isoform X1 n=1 Tax=Erythrolamprus reginae TaxID=121349 RepID=UPI00396CE509
MAASQAAIDCESRIPSSCLTNEDLSAYPKFTNFLMDLQTHIDPSGITIALIRPLDRARREVYAHRANWLHYEILYRLIQEALLKLETVPTHQDKKFLQTLEKQLLLAELKWMLKSHSSNTLPPVLGLEAQHLTRFLPPHQNLEEMQQCLPAKMEEFLKAKCLAVLSYYRPESGKVGAAAKMVQLATLAECIATEKQQLKEEKARQEELIEFLKLKQIYSKVLLHSGGLLNRFVSEFRLETQSKIDQDTVQYFETKCKAVLMKIRLEQLKVMSKVYQPDVVDVHRKMRDKLQASLRKTEQSVATLSAILSKYQVLGPEFEKLVKEYAQVQEMIRNNKWMITQLMNE